MSNHGLQMPEGVHVEEVSDSEGQFVMGPLERGYGVTIGNALRRVLLSSLRGLAITAVKIDGVQHEFSTIPGVTEDVADLILNLKEVRFKADEMQEGHLHLNLEGPGNWTAADIDEATAEYDVLNPDQHVATLAEDAVVNVDLRVGYGRGYVPSEENKREDDPIGVIAIDSIFTPIKNVNYEVKPTRVGQKIDYEELLLDVETDGSLTPEEAITQGASILRDHVSFFIQLEEEPEPVVEEQEVDEEVKRIRELLAQPVDELDLSVRSHNCLKAANIKTIGDLVRREEDEMLKFRNFGRKSLQELVEVLDERGLQFGMDVEEYLEEKKAS
ncbi:DNA-directed RNA polymerase subunit alpha [Salinibacter ruber]|jgi:DNA-directed RNA polymerase subunit alpha|uniref:DNA-directed RNA polymerase subunit alpha n=3 Tax=Salinibacter ruber TaxID=146919 RepID=RPOA_SALRD|nr:MULTISPECIES: DNA-directed RNA polymerase subunit alpha [Salinibacter]Q2S3N9.2 RecName: Full=DNA-directed RNA polymerase subunit alpha; Short=RNAP subunit alpha; AltName: Full=RNA polymerase subunit alpha; AltName: Full=Transcriptase subunit alpha [Salinibacter ruber DSM 13855]MBB4060852.1 DNA-directed RNA polymerase subunit alpha [Salinibacter ruber]MBB4070495.1 DNA-directed RNA polymerase subunit alpha [Salinibacter ruber]MBB4091257.1 DNA-directed RNA polymerase subunit alpha [Salinibacter